MSPLVRSASASSTPSTSSQLRKEGKSDVYRSQRHLSPPVAVPCDSLAPTMGATFLSKPGPLVFPLLVRAGWTTEIAEVTSQQSRRAPPAIFGAKDRSEMTPKKCLPNGIRPVGENGRVSQRSAISSDRLALLPRSHLYRMWSRSSSMPLPMLLSESDLRCPSGSASRARMLRVRDDMVEPHVGSAGREESVCV